MKNERQSKIGLLSRASRGKLILPNYLAALSAATGSDVTTPMLTDLQERDLLLEDFRTGYREAKAPGGTAFSKTYGVEEQDTVFTTTSCFAEQIGRAHV